jgi:hypothetical protein
MSYLKNVPKSFAEISKDFGPLQAIGAWKKIAGPVIGQHAEFLGIHKNGQVTLLHLSVKDPIWRQEIQFESKLILAGLSAELKKLGWREDQIPTEILFKAVLPFRPSNPHFRGNKKWVKT